MQVTIEPRSTNFFTIPTHTFEPVFYPSGGPLTRLRKANDRNTLRSKSVVQSDEERSKIKKTKVDPGGMIPY